MTQAEDAIRQALSPDDLAAYEALSREPSLVAQALQAFQTQHRFFAVMGWLAGFSLFAAALVCVWQFSQASDLRGMMSWIAGAALCLAGLGMIKLWFWMEMQKNSVVREVKRLELQVASLVALVAQR